MDEQTFFPAVVENKLTRLFMHNLPPLRWLSVELLRAVQKNNHPPDRRFADQKYISSTEDALRAWYDGVEFITRSLWPWAFLGMFGYDVFNYYTDPADRYQLTPQDFWLGLPKNFDYHHSALSANLGGDIPSILFCNYWPWLGLIGAALTSGCIFQYLSHPQKQTLFEPLNAYPPRHFFEIIRQDVFCSLPYLSSDYWKVQRSRRRLLQKDCEQEYKESKHTIHFSKEKQKIAQSYKPLLSDSPSLQTVLNRHTDPDLDSDSYDAIQGLLQLARCRGYWVRVFSIAALANLAAVREDKMGKRIIRELSSLSETHFYARYQLWSIGGSTDPLMRVLGYGFILPLQLYARLRLWSLIVTKIMRLIDFLADQQTCQDKGKVWSYTNVIGGYACRACDWEGVDYLRSLQGQSCIDAWLSSPRSLTQILHSLTAVQKQGPFTEIDFSRQAWADWPLVDWQNMLHFLNTTAFNQATTFNLSRAIPSSLAVSPELLAALADYLQSAPVRCLDLSGQLISAQGMTALLPGLRNHTQLAEVRFAQSGLTDNVFALFVPILPGMTALTTLTAAGNQLTGLSLTALTTPWANAGLTDLDLSYNLLTAADIDLLQLNETSLLTLNLSATKLYASALSHFGAGLVNSSLTTLIMAETALSDQQSAALFSQLASSTVQTLSWAGNTLGYSAVQAIATGLSVSKLKNLNLNDNAIDDVAVRLLASSLAAPTHSLSRLTLSGNPFTLSGFQAVTTALQTSLLRSLAVSRVNLGDEGVTALTSALPAQNLSLTQLDLSQTGMTVTGATDLLAYIAGSGLGDLDISHNFLQGECAFALQTALNGTALTRLNLRATYLNRENLQSAWAVLPDSALQSIDVSENSLGDSAMIALAEQLLTPVAYQNRYLSDLTTHIDFNRALTRARPISSLQQINWQDDDQLTEQGAHALCLTASSANIGMINLTIWGNRLQPGSSGVSGCPVPPDGYPSSAASRTLPTPDLLLWGLISAALYSSCSPARQPILLLLTGLALMTALGCSGMTVSVATSYSLAATGLWTSHRSRLQRETSPTLTGQQGTYS